RGRVLDGSEDRGFPHVILSEAKDPLIVRAIVDLKGILRFAQDDRVLKSLLPKCPAADRIRRSPSPPTSPRTRTSESCPRDQAGVRRRRDPDRTPRTVSSDSFA